MIIVTIYNLVYFFTNFPKLIPKVHFPLTCTEAFEIIIKSEKIARWDKIVKTALFWGVFLKFKNHFRRICFFLEKSKKNY